MTESLAAKFGGGGLCFVANNGVQLPTIVKEGASAGSGVKARGTMETNELQSQPPVVWLRADLAEKGRTSVVPEPPSVSAL